MSMRSGPSFRFRSVFGKKKDDDKEEKEEDKGGKGSDVDRSLKHSSDGDEGAGSAGFGDTKSGEDGKIEEGEEVLTPFPEEEVAKLRPADATTPPVLAIFGFEAEGLEAMDPGNAVKAASSDPYLKVRVGKQEFKTSVVRSDLNPIWDDASFEFGGEEAPDMLREAEKVEIEVWDYDVVGDHDLIGTCEIPFYELTSKLGSADSKWRPVLREGEIRGQVFCTLEMLNAVVEGDEDVPTTTEPNQVRLTVLRARHIPALNSGGESSDPLCTIRLRGADPSTARGKSVRTSVQSKTLEPMWNETFLVPADADDDVVLVEMANHRTVGANKLFGVAAVTVGEFRDRPGRTWLSLQPIPKDAEEDEEGVGAAGEGLAGAEGGLGEVEVEVEWIAVGKPVRGPETEDLSALLGDTSGVFGVGEVMDAPKEEDEEEKKKKEEEEAKRKQELEEMTLPTGDYQVQVHVIEARSLNPKNANGSADPVVEVEVLGRKQYSKRISSRTSCVWDQTLFFNFKDLSKEDLEEAVISVGVFNAAPIPGLTRNVLIGNYAFDATFIYYQDHHELHNQWVALSNSTEAQSEGIQGYLKLSVIVLGPGEKRHVWDPREEAKQLAAEQTQGLDSLLLLPPSVERKTEFLVLQVLRAEQLPAMDRPTLGIGDTAIDAFVEAAFAGNAPLKTPYIKSKGKDGELEVSFPRNNELWLPVYRPTMSDRVVVTLKDHDLLRTAATVGTLNLRYSQIRKRPFGPTWFNIYGSPGDGYESKDMNEHPASASTYRGRLLLAARVERDPDESIGEKPHRKHAALPVRDLWPPATRYVLRGAIFTGSELPTFAKNLLVGSGLLSGKCGVEISCGRTKIITEPKRNEKGVIEWHLCEEKVVELPADPLQMPDVFVYLYRGSRDSPRRVCYFRMAARDLLRRGLAAPPQWVHLREDPAINALASYENPGSVLVRMALAREDEVAAAAEALTAGAPPPGGVEVAAAKAAAAAARAAQADAGARAVKVSVAAQDAAGLGTKAASAAAAKAPGAAAAALASAAGAAAEEGASFEEWKAEVEESKRKSPATVRVFIYQGRELPAADENGSIDPFVKALIAGRQDKTRYLELTNAPLWYQTLSLDVELPPLRFAPPLLLQLWDFDRFTSNDFISDARINLMDEAMVESYDLLAGEDLPDPLEPRLRPHWIPFGSVERAGEQGRVLTSVQLIRKGRAAARVPSPPRSIRPPSDVWYLEIVALGCRSLAPYMFFPIYDPKVEFDVGDRARAAGIKSTSNSKRPEGSNPNFCERIILPVNLPRDPLYAPSLNITVRDRRLGGWSTPVVGTCTVSLEDKIPWAPGYRPPRGSIMVEQAYDDDEDDEDAQAAVDALEAEEQAGAALPTEPAAAGGGVGGIGVEAASVASSASTILTTEEGKRRVAKRTEMAPHVLEARKAAEALTIPEDGGTAPATGIEIGESGAGAGGSGEGAGAAAAAAAAAKPPAPVEPVEPVVVEGIIVQDDVEDEDPHAAFLRWKEAAGGDDAIEAAEQLDAMASKAEEKETEKVKADVKADADGGKVEEDEDDDDFVVNMPKFEVAPDQDPEEALALAEIGSEVSSTLARQDISYLTRNLKTIDGAELLDPDDEAVKYMRHRRVYETGLEEALLTAPFETYALRRGAVAGRPRIFGFTLPSTQKKVGYFKGLIRVVRNPDDKDDPCPIDLTKLLKPRDYQVRVYILDGNDITPQDGGSTSDPYIRMQLGRKVRLSDRQNYIPESNDPGFYKCYELKATLPGPSRLEIDVYDYDFITFDDFIGRTVVDLEDRWFEQRWQRFGLPYETGKSFRPKPLEERALWNPTSTTAQGQLRMWVDILTPKQAKKYPIIDISPPPPIDFEIRLIVWRARGVKSADWVSNMSDLYVTGILEGHKPQHTDIHWRAKRGKASWNWRMKWDMELPLGKHDFPYLTLQLWDQDVFKWNDCLAEVTFDLRSFLLKSYKEKTALKIFEDPSAKQEREAATKRAAEAAQKDGKVIGETPKEAPRGDQEDEYPDDVGTKIGGGVDEEEEEGKEAEDAGEEGSGSSVGIDEGEEEGGAFVSQEDLEEAAAEEEAARQERTMWQRATCQRPAAAVEEDEEDDEEAKEEEKAAAAATVSQLKQTLGIEEEVKPEHARWLAMYHTGETKEGKQEDQYVGEIQVSLEIMPKSLAEEKYVNAPGREDPNTFPFLPPPTGRLKLSWNPFAVLAELLGEKLVARLGIWIYVILFVVAIIMLLPYVNSGLTLFATVEAPFNHILLSVIGVVICCPPFIVYIRHVLCVDDSIEEWEAGDDDYAPDLAELKRKRKEEAAAAMGVSVDQVGDILGEDDEDLDDDDEADGDSLDDGGGGMFSGGREAKGAA